jgi:hypothetical protein
MNRQTRQRPGLIGYACAAHGHITGLGPMDIKFTNRLSYKQARLTVLVGFILGTLLSLIQIGIDYASEDASINREIQALLKSATTPPRASPTTSTPNWPRNSPAACCSRRRSSAPA